MPGISIRTHLRPRPPERRVFTPFRVSEPPRASIGGTTHEPSPGTELASSARTQMPVAMTRALVAHGDRRRCERAEGGVVPSQVRVYRRRGRHGRRGRRGRRGGVAGAACAGGVQRGLSLRPTFGCVLVVSGRDGVMKQASEARFGAHRSEAEVQFVSSGSSRASRVRGQSDSLERDDCVPGPELAAMRRDGVTAPSCRAPTRHLPAPGCRPQGTGPRVTTLKCRTQGTEHRAPTSGRRRIVRHVPGKRLRQDRAAIVVLRPTLFGDTVRQCSANTLSIR